MPASIEPEMEGFLPKLRPDLVQHWQGATEAEVEQIEQIAGRPLPRFYRWFLLRMGRSMGPIAYRTLDLSASRVLSFYASSRLPPDPRFLMIGHDSDKTSPLNLFYDFDHPARDDARVTQRDELGGNLYDQFETFREMIAFGACFEYIERLPQSCKGMFIDSGGDVLSRLDPVMKSLGWESPIPTGPWCGIYDTTGAALITACTPSEKPEFHPFWFGGSDEGRLRRILGEISTETTLEIQIKVWDPPIP